MFECLCNLYITLCVPGCYCEKRNQLFMPLQKQKRSKTLKISSIFNRLKIQFLYGRFYGQLIPSFLRFNVWTSSILAHYDHWVLRWRKLELFKSFNFIKLCSERKIEFRKKFPSKKFYCTNLVCEEGLSIRNLWT